MLKLRNVFFGLVALSALYSCNDKDEFQTTEDGIMYKVVEEGKGAKVDSGKVAEILIRQYLETADSVYQEMLIPGPQGALIQGMDKNPMIKAFTLAKVGDSMTVKIPNKGELKKMTPPNLPDSAWLRMEFRVLDVMEQEAYQAKKEKEMADKMANQKENDKKAIEDYIAANNLENVQQTESGLYYVITEEGSGRKPEMGDAVEVHYTGTLLDGTKFDSSRDRGQPFTFPLGMGRVIQGWDQGIALLSEGTKAILLVPSDLGYGPRGAGQQIPPFAPLKFEVELIKATPAPNEEKKK